MQTLTFFTLDDYITDLRRRGFDHTRLESIVTESRGSLAGTMIRKHFVICTAFDQPADETLACDILVCEGWSFDDRAPLVENALLARQLVEKHLQDEGFMTWPGVYHHERDSQSQTDLWKFDKDRHLIPLNKDEADDH
jgi:hypothetical protein